MACCHEACLQIQFVQTLVFFFFFSFNNLVCSFPCSEKRLLTCLKSAEIGLVRGSNTQNIHKYSVIAELSTVVGSNATQNRVQC